MYWRVRGDNEKFSVRLTGTFVSHLLQHKCLWNGFRPKGSAVWERLSVKPHKETICVYYPLRTGDEQLGQRNNSERNGDTVLISISIFSRHLLTAIVGIDCCAVAYSTDTYR